jgi:hypothetical protein
MAKDTTPDGRGDDRRDENTPAQDDAWAERLRREDEDARATTELPAAAPGQPIAPTTPIVADDQRTRELPADGSAFRTATSAETIGTTTRRRPTKRLLVGIGIAAAGLALVGTSTAVAVSNAGSSTSASSTATPGRDDAAIQGDDSRPGTGGRGSDDGATGAPTDAPTPPAAGDDSDGSAPAEGTGPDGKALPTPGTGPDGDAVRNALPSAGSSRVRWSSATIGVVGAVGCPGAAVGSSVVARASWSSSSRRSRSDHASSCEGVFSSRRSSRPSGVVSFAMVSPDVGCRASRWAAGGRGVPAGTHHSRNRI